MIKTFKVLSTLLSYPSAELQAAAGAGDGDGAGDGAGEIRDALLAENLLPAKHRDALLAFISELARADLYQLQARYVALFDRNRSLSLHLFEHVHGDSRERGQAMVDLLAMYEKHGLQVAARELPDYLPLFLEFLSTLPLKEAREILSQPSRIISALKQRLEKSDGGAAGYAAVFAAIESIAGGRSARQVVDEILTGPGDAPDNLDAIDRDWQEQPVLFGPRNAAALNPGAGAAPGRVYVNPPARN